MKEVYRNRLLEFKKYLKLSVFAAEFGLSQPCLSLFMKGPEYDYCISVDTLDQFVDFIENKLFKL